jgi:hypothetical protein
MSKLWYVWNERSRLYSYCDKCKQRFCYVCGIAANKLEGGFGVHNQWNFNQAPDANRCPTYLHYKWGIPGNPAAALDSFHRELQTKALEKLKEELKNDEIWMEVVNKKFQGEPIVAQPVYISANYHQAHYWTPLEIIMYSAGIYVLIYSLFFLAMYCWMIYEGRANLEAAVTTFSYMLCYRTIVFQCSHPPNLLPSFPLFRAP